MPLLGNDYRERTQEEILSFLEAELRAEFGEDIDLTENSAFRTFATAISGVDATDVETALRDVHRAGFLDTASGQNLDNLVAILGIDRRSAVHATGVIEFQHGSLTTTDYAIPNGTIVQTDSDDPVQFETTERVSISLFDDFEDGSLSNDYDRDTGNYTVVDGSASADPNPAQGAYLLRGDAVSDSRIVDTAIEAERGSKMAFHTYLPDTDNTENASAGNLFAVADGENYYRIKITDGNTHAIELVTTSTTTTLVDDTGGSIPSGEWLRNEIDWEGQEDGRIISRLYDSADNLLSEITVTDERTIDAGGFGFENLSSSEKAYWDHSAERATQANIRAREGGLSGNVGSDSVVVMPSPPNGVQSITNPYAVGDSLNMDTDTIQFVTGRPRETDEQLRERAQISEGALGNGTVPALIGHIGDLPGASSVTVFENKTDADNRPSGLPPHSFEVVYYGVDPNQDIADELFDIVGATARDFGGVHGTEITETVQASNNQTFTMHWTEPTEVSVDMTLDIVVNDDFIGTDPLRDDIVEYIGGTRVDGTTALGTGVDEDVYVDQIEDVVTGPSDTGVIGISNYSFTPSVTTDANGLEIVDVGSNEVATTNASDTSITLNVTRV